MIMLDTNVFIYANIKTFPEHEPCLKKLQEKLMGEELIAVNLIVTAESFHILSRLLSPEEAKYRVEGLLKSRRTHFLQVAENTFRDAMNLSVQEGIRINDAIIGASMRQNKIEKILTTNEKDFKKLAWVEIENPLRRKTLCNGNPCLESIGHRSQQCG